MKRSSLAALAVFSLLAPLAQAAHALTILPPGSVVEGKSISEWTEEWFIWAFQAPSATSPISDPTGAFANQDNSRPVFFIAGTGGGTATRRFAVPGGRPVLVPLLNFFDTEPAELFDPPITLAERQAKADEFVAAFRSAVVDVFASIDGVEVTNPRRFLEETDFFSMGPTRPGSVINSFGAGVGWELSPTKGVGYWLMLDDLEPGNHTLHFGGSASATDLTAAASVETTATITVIPEPGSLVALAGLLALLALRWPQADRGGAPLRPRAGGATASLARSVLCLRILESGASDPRPGSRRADPQFSIWAASAAISGSARSLFPVPQ
jgi:hypothetical protein